MEACAFKHRIWPERKLANQKKTQGGLKCKEVEAENDVDGFNEITKRCFLEKQLKPGALE